MAGVEVVQASQGDSENRPELVFGLIGALGTDLGALEGELQTALSSVGYHTSTVRISRLISEEYVRAYPDSVPGESRMADLMRQGDELRDAGGCAAAAALGISRLRNERRRAQPTGKDGEERDSHATILRSIKRKDEVETLREVYGARFLLIGGWATREKRATAIDRKLRIDHPGREIGWYAQQSSTLMARDEKDQIRPHGQGVRDAFELADVYVDMRAGHSVGPRVARLVRLLFGHPYVTPNRAEEAMFLASGAALRSSAAGRQVGVVVLDEDGEVLVTGTNEAPRAGGGQYWAEEDPDNRDFTYGHDVNDRLKLEIVDDILARLRKSGWLAQAEGLPAEDEQAREAMKGPLLGSRVGGLLEFGRIAHAEMAAISTAARRGTSLRGAIMYSTTYPCHECARLIIAAGIVKVIYIDPYPKSQIQEMFRDEVSDGPDTRHGTISFEPFEGVAPRLFRHVFTMPPRSRDPATGRYAHWNGRKNQQRLLADTVAPPLAPMESKVIWELGRSLEASGWRHADTTSSSVPESG